MANPASGAAKDVFTAVLGRNIRKTPDAAADMDAMGAGGLQPALKRPRVLSHDRDFPGENGTHHHHHHQNHQETPLHHHQPPRSQLEESSGGQHANGIHDQENKRGGGGSSGILHQRELRQRGESIGLEKMSLDDARLADNGPAAVLNGAAEAGATTGGAVAGVAYSDCGDFRVPSAPAARPVPGQNGEADYRHPYQHQPHHGNHLHQQQQNGYGGGYRSAPVQQALVNGHAHSNGFHSQHANGDAHGFGGGDRMRHNDGGAGELNGIIVQDLRPNGGGGGGRLDSTSSSSADAALLPLPSIIDYPGSGSGARLGIHQGGSGGSGAGGAGGGAQFTRTKVVCTLGPASREVGVLERMLRAGMNVARFNFSHGSYEYHQETLDNLKTAMERTKTLCAVLLDTKGPEIRTGLLEGGKAVQLVRGSEVVVSTGGYGSVRGDASHISMSYANLARDVRPGGTILCADGSITLTVLACDVQAGTVRCRCENTAMLGERKNVNLPGVVVDLPTVTDKDRHDILHWAVPNSVDFIAASFVRKGSDVAAIRSLLGRKHSQRIHIISKVENQEGLVNFDDILRESDGIMVARGDLGMEIPTEKIFLAQKMMIYKCNAAGKPVVTATQMLESMVKSPRPTRAEATDVANAVLDGTDAVMLSGETAAGAYAVDAVGVMARICREAEACLDYAATYKAIVAATPHPLSLLESLASSGVQMAVQIGAAAIVVLTRGGFTARLVAKYRPPMPVLAVAVPSLHTERDDSSLRPLCVRCTGLTPARQALLVRGLVPLLGEGLATVAEEDDEAVAESATQEMVVHALAHAAERGLCRPGDCVVMLHRIGAAWVMEIVTVPVQDHDY